MGVLLLGSPRPASADVTAFLGLTPTPQKHMMRGFALGGGLLVIGFEFEYATAAEDLVNGLPSLQTGSGNVLLQTPVEVFGMQFYATTGGGVYRERLTGSSVASQAHQETHFATNAGGGAKIRVAGPLRLRLDYRILKLQGQPLHSVYQRFYAGANLSF